jgi:hypothetical protein
MTRVEAKLENRGKGSLEFAESTLKFYVERGRFKKKSEVVREIPLTDIENVALSGTELSITWKGVADIFKVDKEEPAKAIFEEIESTLKSQKEPLETEKAPSQAPNELIDMIKASLDTTDSLFDILRSLHGRVDWNRIGNLLKRSEEIAKNIPGQETCSIEIDFTKSASAIKDNRPEEIIREVYDYLKLLDSYLNKIASDNMLRQKTHPDYEDAKQMLLAYYALNDIIIGNMVGDKEISKERNELSAILEGLAKTMESGLEVDAIIRVTDRLVNEKVDDSLIAESRMVFKQQFTCLVTE